MIERDTEAEVVCVPYVSPYPSTVMDIYGLLLALYILKIKSNFLGC